MSESNQSPQHGSAELKFAVVLETASFFEIERGEYCRPKGLFPEQISKWIQSFISGMKPEKA